MIHHTPFRATRFNEMIRAYNALGRGPVMPGALTIEEFQARPSNARKLVMA